MIASAQTVAEYLAAKYDIDIVDAATLAADNSAMIEADGSNGAFAYWPGDKIATAAGLEPRVGACGASSEELNDAEEMFLKGRDKDA